MPATRIFVRGLPPSLSEKDFRQHFAKRYNVTDIKLFPQRRIGYVGFKTSEDTNAAVKYFDKSFMRMSKIGVELAEPAKLDHSLSRADNPLKRKRAASPEVGISHVKGIRQGGSPKITNEEPIKGVVEGPLIAGAGASESHVATQGEKTDKQRQDTDAQEDVGLNQDAAKDALPEKRPASDQDWMRSRTSRLLGLVDEDEEENGKESSLVQDPQYGTTTANDPLPHNAAAQELTPPPEEVDGEDREIADDRAASPPKQEEEEFNAIRKSRRLFLRNLPYHTREDDLVNLFTPFGPLLEVHIPMDPKSSESKGIGFVQFIDADAALESYRNLDGTVFHGRLLHVLPATVKRETKLDQYAISKLPLKKQKQIQRKAEASSSTFNWNSMFMNADAVISSVSERLGVPKSQLIDPTSSDAAVKQAQAETHVIQETKAFFEKHGVDLNAFSHRQRGDTAILVKNFAYGTTSDDLNSLFGQHGEVSRMLLPPSGTIAIVEFKEASGARSAFAALAYRKFKDTVLFLEKAPKDLFRDTSLENKTVLAKASESQPDTEATSDEPLQTTTLFVRNLNFVTTNERFFETFKPLDGLISARVKTKTDAKRPGQLLSMGFGFLEFRSGDQAKAALSAMDGYELDGHRLLIRASHKGQDAAQERRMEDQERKKKMKKSKIIIKNLPFEASKKDIRDLFKAYGQLRAVRVPKKFDNSRKGYAFAEFTTAREAESAMDALRNTHLLGRRLVLDFAAGEAEDPEKEIEKMQQKVGRQSNSIALRNLTASSERKKFVSGEDDEGG